MTRRLRALLLIAVTVLLVGAPALAHDDHRGIDVIVVSGSLDGRLTDFVIRAIEGADAQAVVLQLDSGAVLDGDLDALVALVADPPVPVAVYAGPAPATVAGGALQILAVAPLKGAAPGVVLGPASPTRAGASDDSKQLAEDFPQLPVDLVGGGVVVGDDLGGWLDLVEPSIGQFVVGLDGREVNIAGTPKELSTALEQTDGEVITVRPSVPVRFIEPGLIDTTLRLGVSPEAAFFFIVMGLSLMVFEFYAAGPGFAAAIAAVCLFLGGYGVSVLPMRWWAAALIPLGVVLYTIDFQRNDLGWKSILGTAGLLTGGLLFTDASPQIDQTWWIVVVIVLVVALWFGVAMTTVVRSRFSTLTIGREHLIGKRGSAESAISPEGTVVLDGAHWRARSSRASGIEEGDIVEVVAVDGIVLDVEAVRD